MRGFVSYVLAHIGLIILGIATIFSIVAVCAPHWSEGSVNASEKQKEKLVFLGLWRTCVTFDYEYFFFYKLNSWTHCIHSHGTDSADPAFAVPGSAYNLSRVVAAAATSLLAFLFLVIAVFIGIFYMFFFFRAVARWLLLGIIICIFLGVVFHIVGLCLWGIGGYNAVASLWSDRPPFNWTVVNLYWGWAFILAIVATILAFIAFVLLFIAFILHKPKDIFKVRKSYTYKEKTLVNGKVYNETMVVESDIRY